MTKRSDWSNIPERGGFVALKVAHIIITALGGRLTTCVIWVVATYYALAHRVARRASLEYLTRLERLAGRETVKPSFLTSVRHFAEFGRSIVDKVRAWGGDFTVADFDFEGREAFREQVARGKGVVILSAHLGNVEVARAVLDALGDIQINALMFTKNAEAFNKLLKQVNPRSFVKLVPVEDLGVDTMLDLQGRVERGECLALMADRVSAGANDRRLTVDFLGGPAAFPEGPFLLASLLECPVYTFWCTRQPGGRYLVRMLPFAERIDLPRARRRERLREWIEVYARQLEQECRRSPLQWFNFFPYWEQGRERESEKSDPSTAAPVSGPTLERA